MYTPIHSGFIIHWTGKKDIDDVYDETSEKLSEFPAKVKFPEDLKDKIQYDYPEKLLIFKGKMTKGEKKELLKLSQDELYKKAIEALSQKAAASYEKATKLYLKRLKDILEYGLWMTEKDEDKSVIVNDKTISRPSVARTCFTELKLSEAKAHAESYGRLGIGVKRPFLFARLGSPMCYFHPGKRRNWFFEPCLSKGAEDETTVKLEKLPGGVEFPEDLKNKIRHDDSEQLLIFKGIMSEEEKNKLLNLSQDASYKEAIETLFQRSQDEIEAYYACFLKQMAEELSSGSWDFKFFNESEWRIIYSCKIRKLLESKGHKDVVNLFEDPKEYHEYYNTLDKVKDKDKPKYLIPLDAWLSMIIYPNLDVKNRAQRCKGIRAPIKKIKIDDYKEITYPCPKNESENAPIEVDLDACSNF